MKSRFSLISTSFEGLFRIKRHLISDHRGSLSRLYCENDLREFGLEKSIVQINHTKTWKIGTVRGLHYQNYPFTESKLVSCTQGKVFDVVVDLRKDSKTFLQWHSEILSSENNMSMYIPEGFAHGFQALTKDCSLIYMHTNFFSPEYEDGINALDPILDINWPIKISNISERDKNHSFIDNEFKGIKTL